MFHHNLRLIGEGMPWPDLTIIPDIDSCHLAWFGDAATPPWRTLRFLRFGHAELPLDQIQGALAQFVVAVLTRLAEMNVTATSLETEWERVTGLAPDEVQFCTAAGRMGLDPFAEDFDVDAALVDASHSLDSDLLTDFLNAVDPGRIAAGVQWVEQARSKVMAARTQTPRYLAELRGQQLVANSDEPPWSLGYRRAAAVREAVSLIPGERFPVLEYFRVLELAGDDLGLQAVGGLSGAGTPVVVSSQPGSSTSKGFLAARALWHQIQANGAPYLITNARTRKEKAERAFAAEVLAPAVGIRGLLPESQVVPAHAVESISRHYNVSPLLVQHQIENQLGLSIET